MTFQIHFPAVLISAAAGLAYRDTKPDNADPGKTSIDMSTAHVTPKIHLRALALAATVAAKAEGGTVTPPRAPSRVAVTLRAAAISDLGLRFDGVGAISGGGATSKLLGAYPPEQRGEVLDLLYERW